MVVGEEEKIKKKKKKKKNTNKTPNYKQNHHIPRQQHSKIPIVFPSFFLVSNLLPPTPTTKDCYFAIVFRLPCVYYYKENQLQTNNSNKNLPAKFDSLVCVCVSLSLFLFPPLSPPYTFHSKQGLFERERKMVRFIRYLSVLLIFPFLLGSTLFPPSLFYTYTVYRSVAILKPLELKGEEIRDYWKDWMWFCSKTLNIKTFVFHLTCQIVDILNRNT